MRKWKLFMITITLILLVAMAVHCAGPGPAQTPSPTLTPSVKPAEFILSDLVINPTEVYVSEEVTVEAKVKNIGELENTKTITLRVNGVEVESKNIALAGGTTETVSFMVAKEVAGTYKIEVDGLTATLLVLEHLPSGWAHHAVHKFEIDLPADWIALDVSSETIDALIDKIGPTNPDLVPYLESLRTQEAIKFSALDPESPPGFGVSLLVGYEVRLIRSLDEYAKLVKKQLEDMGWTIVIGEKFNLKGYDALRLETSFSAYYPNGEPFHGEQQMVIVDHAGDRYMITLSYPSEAAQKYIELFNSVIQTFTIVQ